MIFYSETNNKITFLPFNAPFHHNFCLNLKLWHLCVIKHEALRYKVKLLQQHSMIIKMKHLDTNSSFQRIQQHSDYNKSITLIVRTTLVCCETIKHHHSNNTTTLKYKKCSTKSPPQWLQQRLSTMKQEICQGCGAIVGAVG